MLAHLQQHTGNEHTNISVLRLFSNSPSLTCGFTENRITVSLRALSTNPWESISTQTMQLSDILLQIVFPGSIFVFFPVMGLVHIWYCQFNTPYLLWLHMINGAINLSSQGNHSMLCLLTDIVGQGSQSSIRSHIQGQSSHSRVWSHIQWVKAASHVHGHIYRVKAATQQCGHIYSGSRQPLKGVATYIVDQGSHSRVWSHIQWVKAASHVHGHIYTVKAATQQCVHIYSGSRQPLIVWSHIY